MAERTLDTVSSEIRNLENRYAEQKAENAKLEARIALLDEALAQIKEASRQAEDLKKSVRDMDECGTWTGRRKNKFSNKCDTALSKAEKLDKKIDAYREQVESERRKLKDDVNQIVNFFSWCEDKLDGLGRELDQMRRVFLP